MCGFPAHKLEDYVSQLNSKGFDVIVAALEGNRHVTSTFPAYPREKVKPTTEKEDDFFRH